MTPIATTSLVEAELLLLAFATGMQDATSFPDYHCFASNQTGNTVLLAVGVLVREKQIFTLSNIGISLAMFVAGTWTSGQLGNALGPRRRLWLLLSSIFQTALVFAAGAMQYTAGAKPEGTIALGVISMLAFSSGCQVAMARGFNVPEITTAMATAAYVDLFIDPRIWKRDNRPRNRRALFLVIIVLGSFAGAFAYAKVGSAFALLMSATGKALVTIGFLFNSGIQEQLADESC